MEGEKVQVSGDDVRCQAADGGGEELVVFWIPARRYPNTHVNPICFSREGCQKVTDVLIVYIAAKSFTVQYLGQLGEDRIGEQNLTFILGSIQSHSWFGVRHQQCAHKDVRVENRAQSDAFQKRIQHLGCETPLLGLPPRFIENLLQGRQIASS